MTHFNERKSNERRDRAAVVKCLSQGCHTGSKHMEISSSWKRKEKLCGGTWGVINIRERMQKDPRLQTTEDQFCFGLFLMENKC